MISFLSGNIISKKDKYIVLDVNGVGYKVFLSQKSLLKISENGQKINLYCNLHVRENLMDLYGFLDQKELEFFELLEEIRGVGPKAALEISSLGSLEKIKESVLKQDAKIFETVPGIGRKKAMTIILELTGKIKNLLEQKVSGDKDVIDSLLRLGFLKQDIKNALEKVSKEANTAEEKIKEALKLLGKN